MKKHRLLTALLAVALLGALGCGLLPTPAPEVEIQFAAKQEDIAPGECTILEWEVQGAEGYPVFLDGEEVDSSDWQEVCPQGTTGYELVVAAPGGTYGERVTIQVRSGPGPAPTTPPPTTAPSLPTATSRLPTATPVPPPPPPTATDTPIAPPPPPPTATPVPPPPPEPTIFVPHWGSCAWVGVNSAGINSHQPVTWCPNGSFLTGLDLDRAALDPLDSPVIGQAQCCPLAATQFRVWGACSWVGVERSGINTHQPATWCPDGSYLTGLDLDRAALDPLDSPVIGQAQCCPLAAAQFSSWSSCSWVGVERSGINTHQPVTWCPDGSFLAGLDLDRAALDPLDSPVVGQALCCQP